jgi:hypothetical protein
VSSEMGSTVARLEKVQRTEEAYQRVLRGIDDGDPAVLGAVEPPAIGPAAGYTEDDLARDLGIDPRDRALPRALPRAVSAYADAFTSSFWQEAERARPRPLRLEAVPASITSPGEKRRPAKGNPRRKGLSNTEMWREMKLAGYPEVFGKPIHESAGWA